ncbi:endoglucanase [Devosia lucknowensis]|uniref:cellulase n=1 Tax=Devosia lucknowensis TaxID=1096929 RepID=A0A1Y6EC49_9HYPH|nr:glycosyl hydrolase family 8 [Devosia lucknowensis]SMQ60148.1 endoglucanase [Devosia lucknowensis]
MRGLVLVAAMALASVSAVHGAQQGSVTADEWAAYRNAFVSEGRVIDTANGNISHSEGQGYGLILSYLAGDAQSFADIWAFTQNELMIRDDGLVAWKWDPDATPNVTDSNNASDGDILIAYGLALAGEGWDEPVYVHAARSIADAVGETSTLRWRGRDVLLPGAFGFGREDQEDGPIVNLSYWVFEAFPTLSRLAPQTDWESIAQAGRRLINEARIGPMELPTDWLSLRGAEPAPAKGFPAEFSYNSIRIPLYLLRGGTTEPALLRQFVAPLSGDGAGTVAVESGRMVDPLQEPGYRIIGAALSCILDGQKVDPALQGFSPQSYYGSTLHLLTLSFLRESAPNCL